MKKKRIYLIIAAFVIIAAAVSGAVFGRLLLDNII